MKRRRKKWMQSSEGSAGREHTRPFEAWILLWTGTLRNRIFLFFAYLYLLLYEIVEKIMIYINTPFHEHYNIDSNKWSTTNEKHTQIEVYAQWCCKLKSIECRILEDDKVCMWYGSLWEGPGGTGQRKRCTICEVFVKRMLSVAVTSGKYFKSHGCCSGEGGGMKRNRK
jgi:hypothetical protein